jgi:hypothetical protein
MRFEFPILQLTGDARQTSTGSQGALPLSLSGFLPTGDGETHSLQPVPSTLRRPRPSRHPRVARLIATAGLFVEFTL